jgi:hypothetical protein
MKAFEALKMRWVVWVWNHTPNCAEMSRLTSLSFERPPSFRLRARMWLHHFICVWCKRYSQQLKFLHRAAPGMMEIVEHAPSRSLSDEAKRRIVQHLREEEGCR